MGAAHFSICSFGDPTGYADVSPRNVHERLHQQHATRRQRKHHRQRQERMHRSTYDARKQPISNWRSEAVNSRKPKSVSSELDRMPKQCGARRRRKWYQTEDRYDFLTLHQKASYLNYCSVICRMGMIYISAGEPFYLRQLLLNRTGRSFDDK